MQRDTSQSESLPAEELAEPAIGEPDALEAQSAAAAVSASAGLSRRLFGATFNYGLGQILPKVVSFLLVPVYFSILAPDEVGLIDLATAFGAAIVIFMRFGVPGAVSRFYYDHQEGPELGDYVTTVARFLNASSLLIGVLALVVYPWCFEPFLPGLPRWPFIVMVVVTQIFLGNSELQRRLLQVREQSRYSAVLNVVVSFCNIGLTLLFVVAFRWGAVGVLLAQLIVSAMFLVQAYHYLWPELRGRFKFSMLKGSLAYGIGILPSHILSNFEPLLVRSILGRAASLAAVGQYGLAARLVSPLDVMVSAFTMAYNPVYFAVRRHETVEGQRELARTASHVWLAAVGGCLGIALLGPPVVFLCVPERFYPAAPLIPILSLDFLATTLYILLAAEISYSKRVWQVSLASGCGLVVTLVIAALAVSAYGGIAIACSQVIGTWVATAVAIGFSLQTLSVPHQWWQLARTALLALLSFVVVTLIPRDGPWQSLGIAAAGVFLYVALLTAVGDTALREVAQAGRRILLRRGRA